MVQIYKKILRAKGNGGKKKASPQTPTPNDEGIIMMNTQINSVKFFYYL